MKNIDAWEKGVGRNGDASKANLITTTARNRKAAGLTPCGLWSYRAPTSTRTGEKSTSASVNRAAIIKGELRG